MHIRHALPAEAATLTALARSSKAYWGYDEVQLDAWRADLAITPALIEAAHVFVCETDGDIGAFYALVRHGEYWQLDHLWVLPAQMGRGIGRALLHHAASEAFEGGAREVLVDADPYAEAFYLACGAERAGDIEAPIPGQPQRRRPQLRLPVAVAL
jgi:GNAT superfamily N-acetyltransferase